MGLGSDGSRGSLWGGVVDVKVWLLRMIAGVVVGGLGSICYCPLSRSESLQQGRLTLTEHCSLSICHTEHLGCISNSSCPNGRIRTLQEQSLSPNDLPG